GDEMATTGNGERVVLVTGATGRQGGAVARQLLRRGGFRVRALTRDPARPAARALADAGAEVVRGDMDRPETLRPALDGAYGVFSVQNFWETGYEREIQQGIALADAAHAAGVQHFVYSSVGSAHARPGSRTSRASGASSSTSASWTCRTPSSGRSSSWRTGRACGTPSSPARSPLRSRPTAASSRSR